MTENTKAAAPAKMTTANREKPLIKYSPYAANLQDLLRSVSDADNRLCRRNYDGAGGDFLKDMHTDNSTEIQRSIILQLLNQEGPLSTLQARRMGICHPGMRLCELRKAGHNIETHWTNCAYTLDVVNEDPATGIRTVVFENFKSRGDSVREAFYRYNYADGTSYYDRFQSIVAVGEDERKEAEKAQRLATTLERNQAAIEVIKECIRADINQKTALVKKAAERSGLSKKKITQALQDHTGNSSAENQFWHTAVEDKNAHIYHLNYGVL